MRNRQTLPMQRLLAILLMAVLFFVQGVKLLHRHEYAGIKAYRAAPEQAADHPSAHVAHHCAICDYHLTKDAALPPTVGPLQVLSYQYIVYSFRPSPSYPGMASVHANKGPPAMML